MTNENILLITTDQQRFDTIQALGNRHIFTPHLNYLAQEGIAFTRGYADCPVCVPSRTTIMTGYRGFESGVISNADHESFMKKITAKKATLPGILTENGYQTKAVGKMHFTPARANYGFEDMILPLDYMREYDRKQDQAKPKAHGMGECPSVPGISTVHENDSMTHWIVEKSIDFLETRDTTRPFFLWTSFTKPHPPFDPCFNYWALYEDIDIPGPTYGDWSKDIEHTPQGFLAGSYENTNMHLHTKEQIKVIKRAYYALITQIDYSLGRIFGALRENNLFENTWIVFVSDHGEMLGDHHAAQKNLYFEGSAHVPLIILPPTNRQELRKGQKVDRMAEMADIYPTILEMAGIEATSEAMGGRSLFKVMNDDVDRVFYGNTLNTNFCVMKDYMKLVYSRRGDHYLLFDMQNDPMEERDLSTDPQYKATYEELKTLLYEHIKTTVPQVLDDTGEFIILPAPSYPGQAQSRWFGFHYKDYSIDTFH